MQFCLGVIPQTATGCHSNPVEFFLCTFLSQIYQFLSHYNILEYPVMSTSQDTYVPIEQTSEAIRVTYEICRAGGLEDWN